MRNLHIVILVLLAIPEAHSQVSLSLEECYARAEENYPLIRQRDLIRRTSAATLENVSRGSWPQVSIGGQATYQSDVTRIPLEMPGVVPLSKDQYRVYAEVSQTVYHGGMVGIQKQNENIGAAVDNQKLSVELYQIKDRINDLYFGILLLQEQAAQTELIKSDLMAALVKAEASVKHGTALPSAVDALRAELLKTDQRMVEMNSAEESYRDVLGAFINASLQRNTIFEKPHFDLQNSGMSRPELKLFDLQRSGLETQYRMLAARKKPRFDLFVQGGYGRPALNMLENDFKLYALGGIRLSWLLSGYYTGRNEKQVLALRQESLQVQRESFAFNTGLTISQHESGIDKFKNLMALDEQIISLRRKIRETAAVQLEQGVITSADFIREVNAEDQAKQNRVLHEIQWLMAQAKYMFASGN